MQSTGDAQPVFYLVEKYVADNQDRIKQLENELAALKGRADP